MIQLTLTIIFFLALGTMLYLAVRTLPRVERAARAEKKGIFERWVTSDVPEKLDTVFNRIMTKTLRKTKVFILKIDNLLNKELRRMKPEPGADGQSSLEDFKEIHEETKAEKERDTPLIK